MSYETWKEEFYPIDAFKTYTFTDKMCIEHSLQKWKGALPENREKHNTEYELYQLYEEPLIAPSMLRFDATSCSLCQKYNEIGCISSNEENEEIQCPIVRFIGEACDGSVTHTDSGLNCTESVVGMYDAPYLDARNDPTIMIDLLTRTLEFVKKGN